MANHYHHQNLTDGELPLWRHGRAWWRKLGWEWSLFRRMGLWSVAVSRLGFHIYVGWFGLHLDRTRGNGMGRRWELSCADGAIRIDHPWVRQMEWRASDPWWRKDISIPVIDWLLGRQRCETTAGDGFAVLIPLPEGSYRATGRTKTRRWRRRWYVPPKVRRDVWLDIDGCIPHAGKGTTSYNCGDDGLCGIGGETVEQAIGNAVAAVLERRARYGHDSKGTGREPVVVLNG